MFIRRMPAFSYHEPATVTEALDLLMRYGDQARPFAGGTDLFPAMKKRERTPRHLVNLKGIAALRGISRTEEGDIRIGALTTLGDLERSETVTRHIPILREAAEVMASPQIRTLGTLGGNLCSALPSADTAPPLLVLHASVTLMGMEGERRVPLKDFFTGPKTSVQRDDEILTEVLIPRPPEGSSGTYLKLMRRSAMDLALLGVAVLIRLDERGKICREARIALGAVAPTPLRVPLAEAILLDREIDEDLAAAAAQAAAKACCPRTDSIRASVEYRLQMVETMTKRAILKIKLRQRP